MRHSTMGCCPGSMSSDNSVSAISWSPQLGSATNIGLVSYTGAAGVTFQYFSCFKEGPQIVSDLELLLKLRDTCQPLI